MRTIEKRDWAEMTPEEREAAFYIIVGITKQQLAQEIAEWEWDHRPKKPNAIFLPGQVLAKIPGRIKRVMDLVIIPMDEAKETDFAISAVDPWHPAWEHLFYS